MWHLGGGRASTPGAVGLLIGASWAICWPLGVALFSRAHPSDAYKLLRGFLVGFPVGVANGVVAYRHRAEQAGRPRGWG
jgi:hypothetical protein